MGSQSNKPIYRGQDLKNQDIKNLGSMELNRDAASAKEAVRKSQVETISAQAAQDIIIQLLTEATNEKVFSSLTMKALLETKQPNLEIDSSSTAYLELVEGYKIKAKQLLITDVEVNETHTTLASYLAAHSTPDKQEGDVIILSSAANSQEMTWIKTGAASQGVDGYARLQTDYNVSSIRAMFSPGLYTTYNSASGQVGLDMGTASNKLGAQNLPMASEKFQVLSITNNNQEFVNLALEALIIAVEQGANQGTSTISLRLNNLSGVTGSTLGSFVDGLFTENKDIKFIFQESEALHKAAIEDRALIRQQFASADASLQGNIEAEESAREAAFNTLQSNINTEANTRASEDTALSNAISAETSRASTAEQGLASRLDIVEGGSSVSGSIAKAQADAQAFASNAVSNEAQARQIADGILQSQIDAIGDAVHYKGRIKSDGRIEHKDIASPNHNTLFSNASFESGDLYRAVADITITFGDTSEIELFAGDSLVALTDASATNGVAAIFHVWDNTESADLLREGQLDTSHLERVGGVIRVKANSLGYSKLEQGIKDDIDDKVSLTQTNQETSMSNTHVVSTDSAGAEEGTQVRYTQLSNTRTAAPLGTQRMFLEIHKVYSGGNGNPLEGARAVVRTQELEYYGDCQDFSQVLTVDNAELNIMNGSAKTLSTARISRTAGTHMGVSTGHTASAQGSLLQNIGNLAHAQAVGAVSDIAELGVLSDLTLELFANFIALNPLAIGGIPLDAAVVGDARTATSGYAVVGLGRPSYFDPSKPMTIPSMDVAGSTDASPVSKADIKAKEYYEAFSIPAGGFKEIVHNLDSNKIIFQVCEDGEENTGAFDIEKTSNNMLTVRNGSTEEVTGLEIAVMKLSI